MSTVELEIEAEVVESTPPIREIGFADAGLLMTTDEYDALLIDDAEPGYRYELIRGVLVVSPIVSEAESSTNEELGCWLRVYRDTHPQGVSIDGTLPERYVYTANRRRADRVIWANLGRRPNPKTDIPTIVVEFVSSGKRNWKRDYVEKRREYLEFGVKEYWILDRFARTLLVIRATPTGPIELKIEAGQTYRTEILPGFELALDRLLAAADRWQDETA